MNITKTIDAEISTAVENPHYRVDVAALNLARGLSHGDSLDTPANQFQMKLLTEAVADYSVARGRLTREVVNPMKKEAGIKSDVSWALEFSTRVLTVTPVGPDREIITEDLTVDRDDITEVRELDTLINVYANIIERVGDTFETRGEKAIEKFISKQAEIAKKYDAAKNVIYSKYVQPYLLANGLEGEFTWVLDFETRKITITK